MIRFTNVQIPFAIDSLYEYICRYPNHAVLVIDDAGRIDECNVPFVQAVEYPKADIIGKSYKDIIRYEGTLDDLYKDCTEYTPDSSIPKVEVLTSSGRVVTSDASIFRIATHQGAKSILIMSELSRRNNLTILQQFADAFIRNVNLGVLLIDPQFRLAEISDMASSILGIERENGLNQYIHDIFAKVPPEHRFIHESLLDGAVVRNYAVHWYNDNQRYDLLVDSSILRDEAGVIVGAYVIMKDVSNLRSLEAQLQRNDRLAMIGQIAAGTAHEIRNPLTSIRGFIQLLQTTLKSNKMDKEFGYLEIMMTEINRINELVSEFLLLGKPKNVTYQPTSITKALHDIMPIIESEANLHGISVEYTPVPKLPRVVADSELLKQVCLNISKNAIEAMNDSGVLTITEQVIAAEKLLHIEIHDTGPGIPNYIMDKIFDPFFTTKENGTGLGLAVCQRIIHDMGGLIRVGSKGFGTTFTISIPYID